MPNFRSYREKVGVGIQTQIHLTPKTILLSTGQWIVIPKCLFVFHKCIIVHAGLSLS